MGEFEDKILMCIDRGLNHLGETVKYVIFWHIENTFGLKRDKIPDKPEEFLRGLEGMYGSGAKIIEEDIVREIIDEFGIEANGFIEAVRKVKKATDEHGHQRTHS